MTTLSSIEWTDATWNPTRGCSRVSPGCVNCYAERQAIRHSGEGRAYAGLARSTKGGPRWTGEVRLVPEILGWPLRWRGAPAARAEGRPSRIFVNSMSDLFHESLTDEEIAAVFGVMAAAPRHVFQVLTKRPQRMVKWFAKIEHDARSLDDDPEKHCMNAAVDALGPERWISPERARELVPRWPLPNVWLGTSIEDQGWADERVPLLLEVPAAVRFVSYEPALGPVNLRGGVYGPDWLEGWDVQPVCCGCPDQDYETGEPLGCCGSPDPERCQTPRLDWIIVGGESGPGARPCDVAWMRSVVAQCRDAGVPVFVKQLGADPGYTGASGPGTHSPVRLRLNDRKGGDPSEWPEDLRVREFPV